MTAPIFACKGNAVASVEFGDCRETMRRWAASGTRAQMCVTSPPYFGLRDYGHAGQLGLEQTPDEYIAAMVDVFRCVRDVLADDGTLWLNIGDSYATDPKGKEGGAATSGLAGGGKYQAQATPGGMTRFDYRSAGYKKKDLIGIPWMLAFALRADGWYLRQDIIWHKPNPMPESVTDRCTKAHEYIFLLSKSPRYFMDAEGLKEPAVCAPSNRARVVDEVERKALRTDIESRHRAAIDGGQTLQASPDGKRNRRSVWTVATRPYKGAHFATFPPALIEPCILAGSRPGDVVLDPFMGSGTTAAVALQHGRRAIGCELNPAYAPLISERLATC